MIEKTMFIIFIGLVVFLLSYIGYYTNWFIYQIVTLCGWYPIIIGDIAITILLTIIISYN